MKNRRKKRKNLSGGGRSDAVGRSGVGLFKIILLF